MEFMPEILVSDYEKGGPPPPTPIRYTTVKTTTCYVCVLPA